MDDGKNAAGELSEVQEIDQRVEESLKLKVAEKEPGRWGCPYCEKVNDPYH